MGLADQRSLVSLSIFGAGGGFAFINRRELDEREDAKHHQDHAAKDYVGNQKGIEVRGSTGCLTLPKNEQATHGRGDDVGKRVEGLCGGQAPCGAVFGAEHRHVGIGSGLDARQAAGQHEQREEEGPEGLKHQSSRDEKKGTNRQNNQTYENAALIADAANH